MLLHEFECEIKNGKGSEDPLVDHLSGIVIDDICATPIECFPNEQLFGVYVKP